MAKGHVRKRHAKFFKGFTIGGSIFGILTMVALIVFLILDMINVNAFITDDVRTYTATFINEGAVVETTTYRRGEKLVQPAKPTKEMDEKYENYIFLGWDYTGEGVPDVLPINMYYSFTAKAVYYGFGKFDLSLEDLENMDLETLLKILEHLGIDWEDFMKMFNIDPQDLMDFLSKNRILSFDANHTGYPAYFRVTSYGDFNYSKKKFNSASVYDTSKISEGSINPLRYTADKLYTAYSTSSLPDAFDFVNFDITYNTKKSPFPVPDCEVETDKNTTGVKSDAYVLTSPVDNKYLTMAAYCPAFYKVITALKLVGFSDSAITADEKEYYEYAKANYLKVPDQYLPVIDEIIANNGFESDDYYYVDEVGAYVENVAESNIIPDGDSFTLSKVKNKDPIIDMLESHVGSDFDFNTLAVMLFRRLNIPARMVYGYLVPSVEEYNEITLLNQHYWCEIYVKGIGWMICDCMNAESFLGYNPYGSTINKKDNPITDEESPDKPDDPDDPEAFEQDYVSVDLGGQVSMKGPGDRRDSVKDIFTFKSDYEGTIYFRSRSFDTYDSSGQWNATATTEDYPYSAYSPLRFAHSAIDKYYYSNDFDIHYLTNMDYGVSPQYTSSSVTNRNEYPVFDYATSSHIEEKTTQRWTGTSSPISYKTLQAMANTGIQNETYRTQEQYYRNYAYYKYLSYDESKAYIYENLLTEFGVYRWDNQYSNIVRINEGIRDNFYYDVNFEPYPEDSDPLMEFINRRTGVCNNFATLAVMLYRYIGLPARFVVGYGADATGDKNETIKVTNLDAHAWAEVYVSGIGWIMMDPTGFDDGHGDGSAYGSGFGGNGVNNFEEKIDVKELRVKFNNFVPDGDDFDWAVKQYDGEPFYEHQLRPYIENETDVKDGHRVEWDYSELSNLGAKAPGIYSGKNKVKITIYDEDNVDVTKKYYTFKYDNIFVEIQLRDINVHITYYGPSYTGDTLTLVGEGYSNYFSLNLSGSSLAANNYIRFIPNMIIDDYGSYDITGTFVITDYNGSDITDYYAITITSDSIIEFRS